MTNTIGLTKLERMELELRAAILQERVEDARRTRLMPVLAVGYTLDGLGVRAPYNCEFIGAWQQLGARGSRRTVAHAENSASSVPVDGTWHFAKSGPGSIGGFRTGIVPAGSEGEERPA